MKGARGLELEEIELLKKFLSLRDRCIFILGLRTGFRISEILSLNIEDVLNDKNEIKDFLTVKKSNMKGKISSRSLPIHPELREILIELLKTSPIDKTQPLFISRNHRRLNRVSYHQALKLACEKSGINPERIATHSLRKSYAKNMYKALKNDIFKLQHAMGHQDISSTGRYLQADQEEINNVIMNLDYQAKK